MRQNEINKEKNPRSPWANGMRRLGIAIMIFLAVAGFIAGGVWGVIACPFSFDDFANLLPGGMIGLLIGGLIGVICMAIIMYLAELGVNLRKTAENTQNSNNSIQSNADELKKFKELLDSGIITQEEYEQKKIKLLEI